MITKAEEIEDITSADNKVAKPKWKEPILRPLLLKCATSFIVV